MPLTGALSRTKGLFRRPTGSGDIDMHGSVSIGTGALYARSIGGTMGFAGAASSLVEGVKFLVGTVTWAIKVGDTYFKSISSSLGFSGIASRAPTIFRRKVLSKRILLETGLDLLLEGGGKVYMEGQKVLNFVGTATRTIPAFTRSIAGALGLAATSQRYARQFRTITGSDSMTGSASRWLQWSRTQLGGLSFDAAADVIYRAIRSLSGGTLDFAGDAVRSSVGIARIVEASLDFESALKKKYLRTVEAVLSFAGSAAQAAGAVFIRTLSAAISFAGAVLPTRSRLKRTVSGVIYWAGSNFWEKGAKVYGVLVATGTAVARVMYNRAASGVATFSGSVSTTLHQLRSVAGTLTFRGVTRRTAEFVKKGLSRFGFNFKQD